MKAATSSLHDQLGAIDGVFMSTPKEIYFFSDDPVYANGLDWYSKHFDNARTSDICGESSTHYTKLPTYPETTSRIKQAIPNARFVYVMRHPIDRLVSQYTHMWLERETVASFSDAVDGAVPELIDYSLYTTQLEPFFETFGAESVLPVFVDRMRSDPDGELQRVAGHVGLNRPVRWNHELGANNVSAERLQQSSTRDRLKEIPGYSSARKLVPNRAIERIRDRWRPSDKPELTSSQLVSLTETFNVDLSKLGSWLGVDLSVETFCSVAAAEPYKWQPELLDQYPTKTDQTRS